jgi:hypothetical protein
MDFLTKAHATIMDATHSAMGQVQKACMSSCEVLKCSGFCLTALKDVEGKLTLNVRCGTHVLSLGQAFRDTSFWLP